MGDRLKQLVRAMAAAIAGIAERLRPLYEPQVKRVQSAIAPLWQSGRFWYDKREPREKVLLKILGGIVAVMLLYNVVYLPVMGLREGLRDDVATRQRQLIEARAMMRRWELARHQLSTQENRTVPGKDFSLFSVVEQVLTKDVGHDKITSITPNDHPVAGGYIQHSVDLKLSDLSLGQIVKTLYSVQTLSVPVNISNVHIRQRSEDSHSYDVDMTCTALGKNG